MLATELLSKTGRNRQLSQGLNYVTIILLRVLINPYTLISAWTSMDCDLRINVDVYMLEHEKDTLYPRPRHPRVGLIQNARQRTKKSRES